MLKRSAGLSAWICLAASLCVLFLAGCSSLSPNRKAERKIADALPTVIGPAKSYSVKVDGDAFALARGRARRITVRGEDVQATPNVTLSALDFTARNVRFDAKARRIEGADFVDFTGTMSQGDLNQYLARSHAHPGMALTLRNKDISLAMPISVGPVHTTVTVIGRVAPTSPGADTINFIADAAHLSILPIPAFLVNRELASVNPVVDLSRFKIPIALNATDVRNKTLVITGTADLTSLTFEKSSP